MSAKKLLFGLVFLFLATFFSTQKVFAADCSSFPSICEVSFNGTSNTASVNFSCREDTNYTLNVVGLENDLVSVKTTYQAVNLPSNANSIALNPVPADGNPHALYVRDGTGNYPCLLTGVEINTSIQQAHAQCSWTPTNNSADPGFQFCVNYPDQYSGENAQAEFFCQNSGNINSCGGIIAQLQEYNNRPIVNLGSPVSTSTGYKSCLTLSGYNSAAVMDNLAGQQFRSCGQEAASLIGGAAGTAILPGGVGVATATRIAVSLQTLTSVTQQQCVINAIQGAPYYRGVVKNADGHELCGANLQLSYSGALPTVVEPDDGQPLPPFDYCKQVPGAAGGSSSQYAACRACIESGGIDENGNPIGTLYTAVGCIHIGEQELAADLIRLLLGIAGGVALLSILAGAFIFTTSQGESNRVKEAKELITAAVSGLLFIIFVVIILDFIGVKILQIPGLG